MADSLVKAESPLLQEILADIKAAMKAHDTVTLEVLRTLHSDIKNVAINAKKDVTDEVVLDVLAKSIKQQKDKSKDYRIISARAVVKKALRKKKRLSLFIRSIFRSSSRKMK